MQSATAQMNTNPKTAWKWRYDQEMSYFEK